MKQCAELTLDNIVRIDVVENCLLGLSLPPSVPNVTQLSLGSQQPIAIFSAGYSQPTDSELGRIEHFVELDESLVKVSLKSSKSMSAVGGVYSYDLQISGVMGVVGAIHPISVAEKSIRGMDFSVLLHFEDGSRMLCYFLPNTSTFAVEQNSSNDSVQVTLKMAGKSMSSWIEIS